MVTVSLRDKNNIINLNVAGKIPIRGKTSHSPYFHDPLELLLSALGLCVGGTIINYCRLNDLNVAIFESITLDYDGESYLLYITRPENMSAPQQKLIQDELNSCAVAKELKKKLIISWGINIHKTETLIKESKTPCCGE